MGDVLAHESELLGLVKEVRSRKHGAQKEILKTCILQCSKFTVPYNVFSVLTLELPVFHYMSFCFHN